MKQLNVTTPDGGLTVVARGAGSCGEFDVPKLEDYGIPSQGTLWLSVTVEPKTKCPANYGVLMSVDAEDTTGKQESIDVGGFKNLANVPWTGCTQPSSSN